MAEWESAPASAATKSSDGWESAPQAEPRSFNPTTPMPFAEGDPNLSMGDVGQMGRGVVSGVVGMPGGIESTVRHLIPGVSNTTILPTPQDVESKLFKPASDQRTSGYRELGELVGGMAMPGGSSKLAKGLISGGVKAAEVGERLLPGATGRAQKLVAEIGPTTDVSVLGGKMFSDLKGRVGKLLKERSAAEKAGRAEYIAEGIPKEGEIAKSYRDFLAEKFVQNGHPVQQKLIEESARNIEGHPSIDTLIIERRRLNDIASGNAEGYDGVQKTLAGDLARGLTDIITKAVPSYGKYIETYGKMSEKINLFEDTALGKRITKETSDFLPDVPNYDPATLPSAFFKTKQSVSVLKQLSGGDEKFVDGAAGEYVASQLKDKGATEARAWLNKSKIWLDEVPSVQAEAERYVKNLEKVSHTQEKAKRLLFGGAVAGGLTEGYYRLTHFLGGGR